MPDTVKDRLENSWSYGTNAEYILKIYEDYKNGNPVDSTWKKFFEDHPEFGHPEIYIMPQKFKEAIFQKHSHQPVQTSTHDKDDIIKNIISLYRTDGHRYANINPLINQPAQNKEIIRFIKLLENSLNDSLSASSIEFGSTTTSIQDLLTQLQNTYSHTLSIEASSLETFKQQWCYKTLEALRNKPLDNEYNTLLWLLERLTAADVFERYLANKYPGVKRFSIEGADALLIALEQIIKTSALVNDTKEIVIGLAHRGRLNVLVNLLGKKASALFEEFDGTAQHAFGTGDVKYHQGFSSEYMINGNTVHITLAFNPSHLEIINPVVVGSALARQHTMSNLNNQQVLPILVHGDSSLSGQGVMMELLNMSKTRGYKVGGSIHIVVNNQIGFTTSNIEDTRSTPYCTDIAKMIRAPVLHVNGDDPIAVYHAAVFAAKWRAEFAEDIFIDLVCYRRLGHNEADEPSVTQPLMYQFIKNHPTPAKIFADKLVEQKIIEESFAEDLKINIRKILDAGHSTNNAVSMTVNSERAKDWKEYLNKPIVNHAQTKVDKNILQKIGADIIDQTKHISLHPRVEKIYQDRAMMYADKKPLDWGAAEMLAYATLLNDGFNVRLSGQDSGRGTFFHRHAVLFDQKTNNATIPLMLLKTNKAQFTVIDSLLSEEAVLSFEYGYATTTPKTLVLWEAQFGDFANGAQVVIDQFIASGEQKWMRQCGLVLLLPHGYEGQGPEHSSARIERYLQLAAQDNMRICIPSTPAQIFHLLRLQMLTQDRHPLIIFSPKSFLRHKEAISTLDHLAQGRFQEVIWQQQHEKTVTRLIYCSGKIYYDLLAYQQEHNLFNIVIIRIEQLYPFPKRQVESTLSEYNLVNQIFWVQEESKNQGAWNFIHVLINEILPADKKITYIGRPDSAAPAVGNLHLHQEQQELIIKAAFS